MSYSLQQILFVHTLSQGQDMDGHGMTARGSRSCGQNCAGNLLCADPNCKCFRTAWENRRKIHHRKLENPKFPN